MIKLVRESKPGVLVRNEDSWTQSLMHAVSMYGSYSEIPKKEKDKLIEPCRHEEVKDALIKSSFEKCAFCEGKPAENGNIEVEHYKPKSLYPDSTFEWSNYLPACRKCNGTKLDHDTISEPIVNPYDINPDEVFYYSDIQIKAVENQNQEIGTKTIQVCGLNSVRLMKPRAEILISLHSFCEDISGAIQDYTGADTERKKNNRLRKIGEAIEKIERLVLSSEKYSGFCRSYLKGCAPYEEAKNILASTST